jgi:hypothetical protein
MIERRSAPRYKVLKGATIAFGGNGVECTVRNLSSRGAALDVANPVGLPPSFMLVIEADQFIRRCLLILRSGHLAASRRMRDAWPHGSSRRKSASSP